MSNNIKWSEEFIVDDVRLKVSECGKIMRFSYEKWKIMKHKQNKKGYGRCKLNGKGKMVHRLIYRGFNLDWDIYDSGRDNQIDHIDENTMNNSIKNLRVATNSENLCNIGAKKCNRTKVKNLNVYYREDRDYWYYRLTIQKQGMKTIRKEKKMGMGQIPNDWSIENYPVPQIMLDLIKLWLPVMHGKFAKHPLLEESTILQNN